MDDLEFKALKILGKEFEYTQGLHVELSKLRKLMGLRKELDAILDSLEKQGLVNLYKEKEKLLGLLLHDVLPKDVANARLKAIHQAIKTHQTQTIEYQLEVPAGGKWFEGRISHIKSTKNKKKLVVMVARDITERKQMEEEIKESGRRYRTIFDNTGTATAIGEENTILSLVNTEFQRLCGYSKEEIARLKEEGVGVTVVGSGTSKIYHGKYGIPVSVDKDADQVTSDDFDIVVIPGGFAPDKMRIHREMVALVRDAFNQGKIVASICHGGWMLVSAGILEGRRATSYIAIKDDMTNAGAIWEDSELVRDRNLITSRKPDDLPAFMRAVIDAMK